MLHAYLTFAYLGRFHNSEIPLYRHSHDDLTVAQGGWGVGFIFSNPGASSLSVYLIIQQEAAAGQTSVVGWI